MANKRAVICGVGPGNGMAIARKFAGAGFDLALLARDGRKLDGYAKELKASGARIRTVPADFSNVLEAEFRVGEAASQLGGVDVLVYNASLFRTESWHDLRPSDLMNEIAVGAGSAYAAFRAAGERMKKAGGGAIVATGGGSALHPEALAAAPGLAVAKGALRNLVIAFHAQFAADGILLSTVTVDGDVKAGTFFDPDRIAEKIFETAHLRRERWTAEVLYTDRKGSAAA